MPCPDFYPNGDIDKSKLKVEIGEFTTNVHKAPEFTVEGDGIFDVMMNTATKHLKAQFDGNRIREEDYADAYVQIYQATLQAAIQAWLQKGLTEWNAKVLECQAKLACAQAQKECKSIELIEAQIELTKAQTATEKEKPDNVKAQTKHIEAQTGLVGEQKLTQTEITKKTVCETKQICNQATLTETQKELTEAQIETELHKPDLIDCQAKQACTQSDVAKEQLELLKIQAEAELAKKDLYRRQIEGFDEEYKTKILKIMMDAWGVGFSVAKDSFEASGIPAPMQKVTIDDLYNTYIRPELDNWQYGRPILNKT